jgi:hypothetical protein
MSSFKIIAQDMVSSRRITKTVRALSEAGATAEC